MTLGAYCRTYLTATGNYFARAMTVRHKNARNRYGASCTQQDSVVSNKGTY